MKLTKVKGNTWTLEGMELIPLYRLDEHRCILLDTGYAEEGDDLLETLEREGLVPVGLLCSHVHPDHYGNSKLLQQKFGVTIALSREEAGLLTDWLTMKCYYLTLPLDMVIERNSSMVMAPDVVLPQRDGPVDFCGARFHILHTPGHSPGLITVITPDNVCYVSDTMLSREMLRAKLPHNQNHHIAIASREKIRHAGADLYIMSHKGICPGKEISQLIDDNLNLLCMRAQQMLDLIDRPMTFSEINQAACRLHKLFTSRPRHALAYQRNVTFLVEYLIEEGLLEMICHEGVILYSRPQSESIN